MTLERRIFDSPLPSSVESAVPTATITRNADGSIASVTYGGTLPHTVGAITRDSSGRVTGFTADGTAHTITRNSAGLVTAVS